MLVQQVTNTEVRRPGYEAILAIENATNKDQTIL